MKFVVTKRCVGKHLHLYLYVIGTSAKMGPKRKHDSEVQKTLFGFFQSNVSPTVGPFPSVSTATENDEIRPKKARHYNKDWEKLYSWLAFDDESKTKSMYCKLCTEAKKLNGMVKSAQCTNFQQSTLTRHASLPEHKLLVEAPVLQKDLESVRKRHESKHDAAVKILLKGLHWLVTEDIALVKFKSLLEFLQELAESGHCLSDLSILKLSNLNYDSAYTAQELLKSMTGVTEDELQIELANSPVVTVLADESTDISNHKRLVIYTQIISNDMKPSTRFLTNIECHDATGKGIASAILEEFRKRGIPPRQIMSLGSDGASVMTGKKAGCAAFMKRENPHMNNVHCVAHKLALCTSQAADKIPHLKQHQQILTDLFYYFRGSAKRAARIHEVQKLLDDPTLTYKEIHSVRWLSYFQALTTVYRTTDSLLTYLAEKGTEDPKANGLKKKISTEKFLSITYMLMDAMAPVTQLSQFFQTENVDVALVKVKLDLCLADLEKVKGLDSPYLKKLVEDLPHDSSTFKGQHQITRNNFKLEDLANEFVDSLIDNIKARFAGDDLLTHFSVLGMRPLSFLSAKQLEEYGCKEIEALCDFYGSPQTSSWIEDGEKQEKTSQPLVDPIKTKDEWQLVKRVVLAEQYPRDSMYQLWSLIVKYHPEFTNLTVFAKLALTSSVHTAGCERGFSVQNRILTTFRNRLSIETQHCLMTLKLDSHSRLTFNFDSALSKWKRAKDRRLYEIRGLDKGE